MIRGILFYVKMKFLYSIGKSNIKTIKVKHYWDTPDNFTGIAIDKDGSKVWYLNGKLHREDGPACEYADGGKHWYLNGKAHREDGPAVEHANGDKARCLNGEYYTEDEHKTEMAKRNSSLGRLILKDGYFKLDDV